MLPSGVEALTESGRKARSELKIWSVAAGCGLGGGGSCLVQAIQEQLQDLGAEALRPLALAVRERRSTGGPGEAFLVLWALRHPAGRGEAAGDLMSEAQWLILKAEDPSHFAQARRGFWGLLGSSSLIPVSFAHFRHGGCFWIGSGASKLKSGDASAMLTLFQRAAWLENGHSLTTS